MTHTKRNTTYLIVAGLAGVMGMVGGFAIAGVDQTAAAQAGAVDPAESVDQTDPYAQPTQAEIDMADAYDRINEALRQGMYEADLRWDERERTGELSTRITTQDSQGRTVYCSVTIDQCTPAAP